MTQQHGFTMRVGDRSMRRIQITMAAMQAAQQTAQAAQQAGESMVAQARKSLDEALGALCDANNQTLPEQYSLTVRVADGEVVIIDSAIDGPGPEPPPGPLENVSGPPQLSAVPKALTPELDEAPGDTTNGTYTMNVSKPAELPEGIPT
jgi:hypothetical protein